MRGVMFLVILLVLVVGGAVLLAGGVKEQPTHRIEMDVTANAAN